MSPPARVRTVLVDAGGVLVEPDWGRVSEVLAGAGVAVEAAALAAADPRARHAVDPRPGGAPTDDRGRGSRFFRLLLDFAGARGTGAALDGAAAAVLASHEERNLYTSVCAGAAEALDRLRAGGFGLVLVSNAPPDLPEILAAMDLARRFDHLVVSGILGVEKPDPRIFREALRVSGARPGEAVHLGDLLGVDVAGARSAGIRPVLVDPADLYREADCERVPSLAAFADRLIASR